MVYWISTGLLAALLLGCTSVTGTSASAEDEVATIARHIDAGLVGEPSIQHVALPATFDDLPWAAVQAACRPTNHDLRPFAGETVELLSYQTDRGTEGRSEFLHVIRKDEQILGAYITIEDELGGPHSLGSDWRR